MQKEITLSMGNGGEENNELISRVFFKYFKNDILAKAEDAAILDVNSKIAMSTDSFTVSPLFFSGGDIGKLSVCGTCNDLAMMGAKPKYISIGVIIEEGFRVRDLEKIAKSFKKELEVNGAIVVSGDTKVMPKGSLDKIVINTTGVGEILVDNISSNSITQDCSILISGDIGRHGATIFSAREGIDIYSNLKSDCKSLFPIVNELLKANIKVVAMRDATRGGVASTLNEWAKQSNICIEIQEDKLSVSDEVKGICELLGFEPTALANEGTFCLAVAKEDEQKALEILKMFNQYASIIGSVSQEYPQRVILKSSYGTKRFLDMPTGELLPRIC